MPDFVLWELLCTMNILSSLTTGCMVLTKSVLIGVRTYLAQWGGKHSILAEKR